jgi:hypothetical protein
MHDGDKDVEMVTVEEVEVEEEVEEEEAEDVDDMFAVAAEPKMRKVTKTVKVRSPVAAPCARGRSHERSAPRRR